MSKSTSQVSGNKTNQSSFLDVMIALKNNIMRNLNVADVVRIISTSNVIKASLLTNPAQIIECEKLQSLDVQVDDIMLAIFTTSDFRLNLNRIKNNQPIQKIESTNTHTKNNGVLVGLIYRKETNLEEDSN